MAKIIGVSGDVITIGTDDGSISEVRPCDLNFVPQIGDDVDIYQNESRTVVCKKESAVPNQIPNGGININLQQNVQQPVSVPSNKKAVNKVVYCLLAIFLGGIGIHKFYSGKIGMGIIYILFCWTWIPLIVSVIEFIIALCKKADANGNILV